MRRISHINTAPVSRVTTVQFSERYLVLAVGYSFFRNWAKQYGVATSAFIYLEPHNTEGHIDYNLFLMQGYERIVIDRNLLARLIDNAKTVIYGALSYPVTHNGEIIEWKQFNAQ